MRFRLVLVALLAGTAGAAGVAIALLGGSSAAAAPVPQPGDTLSVPKPGDTLNLPTRSNTPTKTPAIPGGASSGAATPKRPTISAGSTAPASSDSSDTSWTALTIAAALGLIVGAAATYLLLRGSSGRHAGPAGSGEPARAPQPRPTVPPPGGWPAPAPGPDPRRQPLVDGLIAARDLVDPDSVLSRRLGAALAEGGVRELAPIGERFDPGRHHAVATQPTNDPARAELIADVERVGYADAERMIRLPDVVVFRLDAPP